MSIRRIDFVAYNVKDLQASIEFYRDKLGLELSEQWEGMYAEFDVGGAAFGLYRSEGHEPRPGGTVAFNVPNIAEAVAELKEKGLEMSGPEIYDTPVCRMAFYTDPDGNDFMLHEKPKV